MKTQIVIGIVVIAVLAFLYMAFGQEDASSTQSSGPGRPDANDIRGLKIN